MTLNRLLIFSLGLNLVLGLWLFSRPDGKTERASATKAAGQLTEQTALIPTEEAGTLPQPVMDQRFEFWPDLESQDLAVYAANLRSIECPKEVVRLVINAELMRRSEPKVMEFASDIHQRYYQILASATNDIFKLVETELKKLGDINDEIEETVQTAMPPSDFGEPNEPRPQTERLTALADFLSEGQASRAIEISDRYAVERDRARNEPLAARAEELKGREQAELALVMNAQELQEYNLRRALPGSIKEQIPTFTATFEEWRQMVEIQERAKETNAPGIIVEQAIAQFLGPERAQEYKRHQDREFREFVEITQELGLPETVAIAAKELRDQSEKRKDQIESTAAPTAFKEAQLEAWREQTINSLSALLGQEGAAAYAYRHSKGWLDRQ